MAAELAAERSFNKLILQGRRLKVMWGRSQGQAPPDSKSSVKLTPVPGLPGG